MARGTPLTPGLSQKDKMRATVWATLNKARFEGLNIKQGIRLINQECQLKLNDHVMANIFAAIEVKPRIGHQPGTKRNGNTPPSKRLVNTVRMLARILRNFMHEAGATEIPMALQDIAAGLMMPEELPADPLAPPTPPAPATTAANGNGNGHLATHNPGV